MVSMILKYARKNLILIFIILCCTACSRNFKEIDIANLLTPEYYGVSSNIAVSGEAPHLNAQLYLYAIKAAEAYNYMLHEAPFGARIALSDIGKNSKVAVLGSGVNRHQNINTTGDVSELMNLTTSLGRNYGYNSKLSTILVPNTFTSTSAVNNYDAEVLKYATGSATQRASSDPNYLTKASAETLMDDVYYTEGHYATYKTDKRISRYFEGTTNVNLIADTDYKAIVECDWDLLGCGGQGGGPLYNKHGPAITNAAYPNDAVFQRDPDHGVFYGSRDIGYGTEMAGIIAAKKNDNRAHGVSFNSEIISIKNTYLEGSGFYNGTDKNLTQKQREFALYANFDPTGGSLYYSLKYALQDLAENNSPIATVFNHDLIYFDFSRPNYTQGSDPLFVNDTEQYVAEAKMPANYDGTQQGGAINTEQSRRYGLSDIYTDVSLAQVNPLNIPSSSSSATYYQQIKNLLVSQQSKSVLVLSTSSIAHVNMAVDASVTDQSVSNARKSNDINNSLLVTGVAPNPSGKMTLYLENGAGEKIIQGVAGKPYYEDYNGCKSFGIVNVPTLMANDGSILSACVSAPAIALGLFGERISDTTTWLKKLNDTTFAASQITSRGRNISASYVAGAMAVVESYVKSLGSTISAREIAAKFSATADTSVFANYDPTKHGAGMIDLLATLKATGVLVIPTTGGKVVNAQGHSPIATQIAPTNSFLPSLANTFNIIDQAIFLDQYGFPYKANLVNTHFAPYIRNNNILNNYSASSFLFNNVYSPEITNVGFDYQLFNGNRIAFNVYGEKNSSNEALVTSKEKFLVQDIIKTEQEKEGLIGGFTFGYNIDSNKKLNFGINTTYTSSFYNNKISKWFEGLDFINNKVNANNFLGFASAKGSNFYQYEHKFSEQFNTLIAFISGSNKKRNLIDPSFGLSFKKNNTAIIQETNYNTNNLNLGFSFGALNESEGLLGTNSTGALSFGSNSQTLFFGSNLGINLAKDLLFFARYTEGSSSPKGNSNSLYNNFTDLKSRAFSVGLIKTFLKSKLGIIYNEPLRIYSGLISLNVPIARDKEGNITRLNKNVSLRPTGKERNLELFFSSKLSDSSNILTNFLYQKNPNHNVDIKDAYVFALKYMHKF